MKPKKSRLIFIDIARSFAILLMLEGHFIDLTLGAQYRSPDPHFVNPNFLVYDIWHLIRGYTSPMFLTMTGMVITYLFYANNDKSYRDNDRVKKGFRRLLELLFWGYLLNPASFHILQCIGYGIFGLLVFYGIYKITKVIPLWVYYMAVSFIIFSFFAPLNELDVTGVRAPWPVGWPEFIQNMIHAPSNRSMFPLAPNLGYTFFGAAIGVILHSKWILISKWNIPLFLFSFGIIFLFFSLDILQFVHNQTQNIAGISLINMVKSAWLLETLGWVLLILGFLATFEKLVTIKENLFIRIGQNTLSIFIIHMMLLYGAIIRVGIGTFFSKTKNPLNPYEAGIGAALFITLFVVMIYYIDPLTAWFNKVLDIVIPIRKKIRKKT